jgi:WD40 repeat protein
MYQDVYIVSWDLQTGGVVSAITHHDQQFHGVPKVTYLNNGKIIGVSYSPSVFMISIYNVVSGIHMHNIEHDIHGGFCGRVLAIWTHGEFLRVATTELEPITIWEVRFTPRAIFTLVETLYVPDILNADIMITPTPLATYRIVLRREGEISVWDTGDSKLLLCQTNVTPPFYLRSTFSSDGRSLASLATESEVYIWKEHSTGYILHGKLEYRPHFTTPLLSPDGKSIITYSDSMLRLWHTENLRTTPSSSTPQRSEDFVLDFFSDGLSAVVTRLKDNVVVVLDLKSGLPQLTIDTGMEVSVVLTQIVILSLPISRQGVKKLKEKSKTLWPLW